jgi:hypothetical protein
VDCRSITGIDNTDDEDDGSVDGDDIEKERALACRELFLFPPPFLRWDSMGDRPEAPKNLSTAVQTSLSSTTAVLQAADIFLSDCGQHDS